MERATTNLRVTMLGAAALIVVGAAIWFGPGPDARPPDPVPQVPASASAGDGAITVHVSGAVTDPGVVTVPAGARVADVVAAAGGATRRADLSSLNLAAPVRDGAIVVVPSMDDPASPAGSPGAAGIDVNTADAPTLEGLPGVGPVLAARIVSYREANGRFDTIEDLLDVPGIGEAKLAGMRDDILPP